MQKKFTHLDSQGNPAMVNVGQKAITQRTAKAQALVQLNEEILELLEGDDIRTKKGPVFQTAIIAGTMGAKRTSDLIPFCHPLPLSFHHLLSLPLHPFPLPSPALSPPVLAVPLLDASSSC